MKFAFLIHPLSAATQNLFRLDNGGTLLEHWGGNLLQVISRLHQTMRQPSAGPADSDAAGPRVVDRLMGLRSARGASAEGRLYEIPMDAAAILDDPGRAVAFMEQAVDEAAAWGAEIVGLGSMTGIVGGHGSHLQERGPVAVTTGNSLTVFAAVQNLLNICAETDIDLSHETVAVVGIPGSVATACARLLAPRCRHLLLVGRQASPRAKRLAAEMGADLLLDIPAALARARIVMSATSSGSCIEQRALLPGSVVVDVGVPADVKGTQAQRGDVLILSGGLGRVPEGFPRDSLFLKFFFGLVPSCLGETMALALENRAECWSIGRDLDLDRIAQIGALAEQHGFDFAPLVSFGLPVEASALAQFLKARSHLTGGTVPFPNGKARENGTLATGPSDAPRSALAPLSELADRAAARYGRFVNPVLAGLGKMTGLVKTFVRGQGNELFDGDGRAYLDFVAGFGALNLGHNHPAVVRAVQGALAQQAPGFTPAGINPWAAALAAKLVALAPAGLEMAFFCNSGTEAVEAALKLARAATGRSGFLYCERSFHGKSLGSLSVTGNPTYQRPFGPLLSDCHAIPFGDEEALERALASRSFAAFIVEPVQAEGGMYVPPAGYLRAAQVLCQKSETLLIADEVQTGLGRTGTMFAVEQDGVEPDLLTLAKSLGGGLIPIGAMLARRDLWQKVYGTAQSFALHTSTFGGGSLACAAALATLEVLVAEQLPAQAAARGHQLFAGLNALVSRCPVLRQVRGQGLLLGVEFEPLSPQVLQHFRAIDASSGMAWFVPQLDDTLKAMRAHYALQSLLQTHGIFTQTARSHPCVLRVQPPLTVTPAEARRFLQAMEETCEELEAIKQLMEAVVTKSIGEVEVRGRQPGPAATL